MSAAQDKTVNFETFLIGVGGVDGSTMNLVGDNIVMQCQMVDTPGTTISCQPSEQENGKTGFLLSKN